MKTQADPIGPPETFDRWCETSCEDSARRHAEKRRTYESIEQREITKQFREANPPVPYCIAETPQKKIVKKAHKPAGF